MCIIMNWFWSRCQEWGRGAARYAAQQKKPGKREEKSAFTDDIMTESEVSGLRLCCVAGVGVAILHVQ